MSDWIERDGKKYFEESYLLAATESAKRRGDKLAAKDAEIERLRVALRETREAAMALGRLYDAVPDTDAKCNAWAALMSVLARYAELAGEAPHA